MLKTHSRLKPGCYLMALLIMTVMGLSGCDGDSASTDNRSLSIFVSVPPQLELIKELAGPGYTARSLIQPGQSPATYDPTPRQMAELAEADLCFLIGVPFEQSLVERAGSVLGSVMIVESQSGISLRRMKGHDHYGGGNHAEIGLDPHVWLSPRLMKQVAVNMADGLGLVDSLNSDKYAKSLVRVLIRLDSLDMELRRILSPFTGDTLYVFHPSYGYLADEYGLIQVALEPEGKEADANYLAWLMTELAERNVAGIFVQPQFSDHLAQAVASGIETDLVLLDPLKESYFENMIAMANKIARVLSGKSRRVVPGPVEGS